MMVVNCQSCMMPISKDPKGGGSEKDGSKSDKYCSLCYENGEFLQPNMTLEEMRKLVIEKLAEMKIPKFLGKLATHNMGNLDRWKKV